MRSRDLRPGFFTNEHLVQLHPLTRILFQGLWCMADRDGILEDRPLKIKMQVLPADDHDVNAALDDLAGAEVHEGELPLLVRYADSLGKRLLFIPGFTSNQNVHPKESSQGYEKPASYGEPRKAAESNGKQLASNALPSFPSSPSIPSIPSDGLRHQARARDAAQPVSNAAIPDIDPDAPQHAAGLMAQLLTAADPGAKIPPILDPWAAALARLHIRDSRPWSEIEAVMRWALAPGQWWLGRVTNATDFVRHFDKIRAQHLAAANAPPGPKRSRRASVSEQNRAALQEVLEECSNSQEP